MIRLLLATVLVALVVLRPSGTSAAGLYCPLFFTGDPNLPEAAKKVLSESGETAVAICAYSNKDFQITASVSLVTKSSMGICTFSTFDGTESETYMLRSASPCPAQDHNAYMRATNISEGIFVAVTELAHRIQSSPVAFDRALQSLEKFRREKTFNAIRRALTLTKPNEGYEFLGLRFDEDEHRYILEYGERPDCGHGLVYGGKSVEIHVDLIAEKLRIVDMQEVDIISGISCIEENEFDYRRANGPGF